LGVKANVYRKGSEIFGVEIFTLDSEKSILTMLYMIFFLMGLALVTGDTKRQLPTSYGVKESLNLCCKMNYSWWSSMCLTQSSSARFGGVAEALS
jgi:hypothetical protein